MGIGIKGTGDFKEIGHCLQTGGEVVTVDFETAMKNFKWREASYNLLKLRKLKKEINQHEGYNG